MSAAIMIEPEIHPRLDRRAFRRMPNGALEWACLNDWLAHGIMARFYGYANRELPDSFRCGGENA